VPASALRLIYQHAWSAYGASVAVLCVLIRTPEDSLYSGVFLEQLTAEDLKRRIAERYNLDVKAITSLLRISKKGAPSIALQQRVGSRSVCLANGVSRAATALLGRARPADQGRRRHGCRV